MSTMPAEKTNQKTNLLDLDESALKDWLVSAGEPAYRSRQLTHWIHHEGVIDFDEMTNISKRLREKLHNQFFCAWPTMVKEHVSSDGTVKWLLHLAEGNAVEMVLIPDRQRLTLCVSSQVGCALNCTFCATGLAGFNRNLKLSEIIGQLWLAREQVQKQKIGGGAITNVVMMGMGEPLLNYQPVLQAVRWMCEDTAYGLSKYRVTLSTSGVLPAMRKLSQDSDVALAVSLHAPTDELRNVLVPINKKYPLRDLLAVCREYYASQPKRQITMEYVMLDGVNDQLTHADQLAKLLRGVPCKINLIPFNESPGLPYTTSPDAQVLKFQRRLAAAGYNTRIRRQRGNEVAAACGQLAGEFEDRTHRRRRINIPVRVEAVQENMDGSA